MHEQTHVDCIQSIDNCQLIELAKNSQARAQCGIYVKAQKYRNLKCIKQQFRLLLDMFFFRHCIKNDNIYFFKRQRFTEKHELWLEMTQIISRYLLQFTGKTLNLGKKNLGTIKNQVTMTWFPQTCTKKIQKSIYFCIILLIVYITLR